MSALTIDLRSLIPLAGSEDGARVLFERLIVALMKLKYRDAYNLRAKQGDWGIDCFSGTLAGGEIIVWQSKFFINGIGPGQQTKVKESFASLMAASSKHGFRVLQWVLCVPCNLSPNEMTWWQKWKKGEEKLHNISIDLLDEDGIRELLGTKDAEHIRKGTFGPNPTWAQYFLDAIRQEADERDIFELPEPGLFEKALFVRQLKAANVREMTSAKRAFFNAELVTQEIRDRANPLGLKELRNLDGKIQALWETRFNEYLATSLEPSVFYAQFMKTIEDQHDTNLRCSLTATTFVHKQGIGHQLADRCRIGWIRDFRETFGGTGSDSA